MDESVVLGVRIEVLRELLRESLPRTPLASDQSDQGVQRDFEQSVWTARLMREHIILPLTREKLCAFTATKMGLRAADRKPLVAPANVFVSYWWGMPLTDLLDCVEGHEKVFPGSYYWVDILSYNQHVARPSHVRSIFESVIAAKSVEFVLAIMTPWNAPVLVNRLWCLFEVVACIKHNKNLRAVVPTSQRNSLLSEDADALAHICRSDRDVTRLVKAIGDLSIENAVCELAADKEAILAFVNIIGGPEILISYIKQALRAAYASLCRDFADSIDDPGSLTRLALIIRRLDDPHQAIAVLKTALRDGTPSPAPQGANCAPSVTSASCVAIHLQLGHAFKTLAEYPTSEHHYRECLKGDQTCAKAYRGIAAVCVFTDKCEEALGFCEKAEHALHKNNDQAGDRGDILFTKAFAYLKLRRYDEAIAIAQMALHQGSSNQLDFSMAELHELSPWVRGCRREDLQHVANLLRVLARAYSGKAWHERARAIFHEALSICKRAYGLFHQSIGSAHHDCAQHYLDTRDLEQADAHCRQAIESFRCTLSATHRAVIEANTLQLQIIRAHIC